ncbi:MAG: dTDP-4-dehydrorhamnose reductase, partial [Desulfuromonadales bacterium]|nr:dTDP-4-dehydrorhamnose reductase [Desulfuromonadales bacterium]NIR33449.1 dTDP-4-dehydrorhamnose reductase [Desulfuromonadales bacterium]NIS41894.1 dTDP-4-dehydrorhamnose reductase [Desulfuromonadales bacterium]
FDITDREQVLATLSELQPAVIVNCAAYTNVDGCESEEALATRVNGDGPGYLAEAALEVGATLVHVSTDYVFDGTKRTPYTEADPPCPVSAYGRSKLAGEQAIRASGLERFFILRTSWLYGPGGKNFVETILRLAGERDELRVVADQIGCPTYTADLAEAIFALLKTVMSDELRVTSEGERQEKPGSPITHHPSPLYGLYHLSNEGQCSWHEFAEEIVRLARERGAELKVETIRPITTEEYPLPAPRPAYSVFSKEKYKTATGCDIPHWREALKRYMDNKF